MNQARKRVLVVDDDASVRNFVTIAVERCGGAVADTAATGLEALEMVKKHRYNLAIVDLIMPEMDGVSVFKVMRREYPETEVIVLTGCSSPESRDAAREAGVYAYLTKPFDITQITTIVQEALAAQERRAAQHTGFHEEALQWSVADLERKLADLLAAIAELSPVLVRTPEYRSRVQATLEALEELQREASACTAGDGLDSSKEERVA